MLCFITEVDSALGLRVWGYNAPFAGGLALGADLSWSCSDGSSCGRPCRRAYANFGKPMNYEDTDDDEEDDDEDEDDDDDDDSDDDDDDDDSDDDDDDDVDNDVEDDDDDDDHRHPHD